MNITEQIAKAKAAEVNQEKLEALQQKIKLAEKQFEERARAQEVTKEFLARTYSL